MEYRAERLWQLADRLGFTFSKGDEYGLQRWLEDFRLTSRGRDRTIANVLREQQGLHEYDAYLFDFSYREFGAKQSVHQTVFFLHSQRLVLPELCLQPESLLHKMGQLFGWDDIDFVRFPKFSRQYRLTGEDEGYIRHHFTEDVLNYFTLHKGWSVEGIGYYLLVYKKGVLLPPEEVEQLYRRGLEVYALFSNQPC
ncbi:hypothetical protein [Neolewinella litorea]|uniref:Uncharacterized protein n=1 Tax=Neolewinella litorea TaxID=2562452 RepID=A0A4S4NVK7_9BACT|nr:hypothetical protein [Neolewinella litorea]THH40290.1 hypothetical protein E4021_06010 [Neolewinella litorea]